MATGLGILYDKKIKRLVQMPFTSLIVECGLTTGRDRVLSCTASGSSIRPHFRRRRRL
jgi:hypothetical protein